MATEGFSPLEAPERPTWAHWCNAYWKKHTSERFICQHTKTAHTRMQGIMREMFIGKASAVILGFLLKTVMVLTLLRLVLGPLGNLVKIDKTGAPKIADPSEVTNYKFTFVLINLTVFIILLAFSSTVATAISSCLPKQKKGEKLIKGGDDDDSKEHDGDDDSDEDAISEVTEVADQALIEMGKTYVAGSKLIPAWAWKDFICSTAIAISLWMGWGPKPKPTPAWIINATNATLVNTTTTILTTTTTTLINVTTTNPFSSNALQAHLAQVFDFDSVTKGVIACVIILASAILSLLAEDVAHQIGSCDCIHTAFDSWSSCMALGAGWSINSVINSVLNNTGKRLGIALRIGYLCCLSAIVHCVQSRLNKCRDSFMQDTGLPTLPRIFLRLLRLLIRAGNFVIGWAWKGFLEDGIFAKFHYSHTVQALIVTAVGIGILLIWPCCCTNCSSEWEGVVHTTIGLNIGWFWMACANEMFRQNAHNLVDVWEVWKVTLMLIFFVVLWGLILEFLLLCGKRISEKIFWSDAMLELDSDDENSS